MEKRHISKNHQCIVALSDDESEIIQGSFIGLKSLSDKLEVVLFNMPHFNLHASCDLTVEHSTSYQAMLDCVVLYHVNEKGILEQVTRVDGNAHDLRMAEDHITARVSNLALINYLS